MTEILETFPRVFCLPKSRINENGGKRKVKTFLAALYLHLMLIAIMVKFRFRYALLAILQMEKGI